MLMKLTPGWETLVYIIKNYDSIICDVESSSMFSTYLSHQLVQIFYQIRSIDLKYDVLEGKITKQKLAQTFKNINIVLPCTISRYFKLMETFFEGELAGNFM